MSSLAYRCTIEDPQKGPSFVANFIDKNRGWLGIAFVTFQVLSLVLKAYTDYNRNKTMTQIKSFDEMTSTYNNKYNKYYR